jgi:hypothetical protein
LWTLIDFNLDPKTDLEFKLNPNPDPQNL